MSLYKLVDIIEQQISKDEPIKILRFLVKHNIVCNENNNGIYINVTNIADDKIDLLKSLVKDIQKHT